MALSSQHSLSGLEGCFLLQCLQTGVFLYLLCFSFCVCFFSSLFAFAGLFTTVFIRFIISFIASVIDLMWISICFACASVRFAINSLVASAYSLIRLALNYFAVSLFCLFSFECSVEMKIFMFIQVLSASGLTFHSLTAALYSPDALRKYKAVSLRLLRFDWIPALSSCLMAFLIQLK